MILEAVMLHIKPTQTEAFESCFITASAIIKRAKGYIEHELNKCIEHENQYLLLIKWERLENHMTDFRNSADYLEWKTLLHHFYEPFPIVEHFNLVNKG